VHDLVRHLAARGVNVTLIVPPAKHVHRPATADPFASQHIHIRHVGYLSFPFANRRGTTVLDRSTAYLLYGWRAGRLARSLANEGAVDVVHGFGASVLGASEGMVAPLVLNPQGLEEFGATAGQLTALKQAGYAPLRWAVRHVAARASCIIATDVSLEPTVVRHLKPAAGQMRTIPNGIDLVAVGTLAGPADGLLTRRRHAIGPGEIVFLSVGRLEFNKGFDLMPAALAAATSIGSTLAATGWRWVIVGGGPYRPEIERQIALHGLEPHVTFTGRLSERDLHTWYEAADVFVHPTRYEGSSLVTLEAMAHRLPVIATVAGGLPDKVHPGVNGWLVEPNDPDALARALAQAAANATDLVGMGARSRKIVERDFAWNVLAERYLTLYQDMLADRRI
jgi:glycosyltransferase involved in cell wall biosynthesis